jgi:hypothetical protein
MTATGPLDAKPPLNAGCVPAARRALAMFVVVADAGSRNPVPGRKPRNHGHSRGVEVIWA